MKNKICNNCKSINGERATYCRQCGGSLDDAVITEVEAVEIAPKPKAKVSGIGARPGGNRPASGRPADNSSNQIVIPKRPAKPDVVYWPFVVSLISAMVMLGLIVAFVLTSVNSDDSSEDASAAAISTTTGASSVASSAAPATEVSAADLSEITIGDIADQTYTGDAITIPFGLVYNGIELTEGVDYTVTYEDNIPIGTASVYFEGTGDRYTGSFSTTFNIVSGDEVCDDPANHDLNIFVMRIYWTMVGRSPSMEELTGNVHRLRNNEVTGVDFINEITFCDEAVNRQMNDIDFVNAFYQGALGRPADQAGLDYNVGLIQGGMSRTDFANAILNAPGGEFENICISLGITPV